MVRRLALKEAQKDLSGLIHDLAVAGDSVEIEDGGRVVARLVPESNGHAADRDDEGLLPLETAFADFDEDLLERFHEALRELPDAVTASD